MIGGVQSLAGVWHVVRRPGLGRIVVREYWGYDDEWIRANAA